MKRSFNILSIEGGGINGKRVIHTLIAIEERTGKQIYEMFGTIAGTSTGSMIGALLSLGYSATQILSIYESLGKEIFEKSFFRLGIFRDKYSDKNLNDILFNYFRNKRMKVCKSRLIIPTYDIIKSKPVIFDSFKSNARLFDVVRASSSAQSYFKPHAFNGSTYIDGGNVINNPSEEAWDRVKELTQSNELNVLSIGTGRKELPINKRKRGIAGWAKRTVSILMNEQAQQEVEDMFTHLENKRLANFYHIEASVKYATGDIDDVSDYNMDALNKDGIETVNANSKLIDIIINKFNL